MSITEGAWIGISDTEVEGTWVDFDGKVIGSGQGTGFTAAGGRFTKWAYSTEYGQEPNDSGNEDYAGTWSDGMWNDFKLTDTRTILCQKPVHKSELNQSSVE